VSVYVRKFELSRGEPGVPKRNLVNLIERELAVALALEEWATAVLH